MNQNWIIKSDELPGNYGKYPGARPVEDLLKNGFLLLDKWAGPTSHDAVATLKKNLSVKKAGHSGTLALF